MELAEFTRQLGQVYARGDRYCVIEQGHRALSEVSHAPELTALVLRVLVELGLGGPARELLELRRDLDGSPEIDNVRAGVESIPHGRVRWSELAEVYERNASALCASRPELREVLEPVKTLLADIHLYRGSDGGYRIARREPGKLREWLVDLTGPPQDSELSLPPSDELGAVALLGLRANCLLARICEGTSRVLLSHSKPVFVVEPVVVRFAAVLHCEDFTDCFRQERVQFFVGPDAPDRIEERLMDAPYLPLPKTIVTCCADPGLPERVMEVCRRISKSKANELARLTERIERRYRGRDAAYWAERFAPPGKVLGFTSRFTTVLQYSMRDTLDALRELGYETHMVIEEKDHHMLSPIEMCRAILEHDPVAVLLLDHLRYETPHLTPNVPLLTWIQDPLPNVLCEKAGGSIGALDFVCGYYRAECTQRFGYPPDQFEPADMPVSTRIFHDGPARADDERRYACDVSFVSNASVPIDRLFESLRRQYGAAEQPLLEAIYRRVRAALDEGRYLSFHETAAQLVRSVAAQLGLGLSEPQVEILKTSFAFRLYDWGRRQQTLEWVADWARRTGRSFRIYGRGWESHPTLAEFAAGVVEHGEPLRLANRGSRLGLQLISTGFRHQRSYELLACGTLPLTRYCETDFGGLSIEEYYRRTEAGDEVRCAAAIFPELERIVFSTPEGFAGLAERFSTDDDYRRLVRDELAAVVRRDYTYQAVVRKVSEAFREYITGEAAKQLSPVA